jgi:maleylacetoacetate isomerase
MMPKLHLYSYFRSSCSARIRIAANLKAIPLTYHYINLPDVQDPAHPYRLINPNGTVPTLVAEDADGTKTTITQSVAALEYLEEMFPDTQVLLPPSSDPARRAKVRELMSLIATDVQPPTNLRIQRRVSSLGGDPRVWAQEIIGLGFDVYEKFAEKSAGKYSVGDEVTLADVVLAPAVERALGQGVDLAKWGTLNRVWREASSLDGFKKGHWTQQGDTPDQLRKP